MGGGAAGLNAALVLGRARRRVVVLDSGSPLNAPAPHMHGFLSRDGTSPLELLRIGRAELEAYGVPVVAAHVSSVSKTSLAEAAGNPHFEITLEGGQRLRAQRLIVAHGMRLQLPEVPGLQEVWGDTAANCPYCHGWEVRDRPLAVLGVPATPGTPEPAGMPGAGMRAAHLGVLLTQWSPDVLVFPNGAEIDSVGMARLEARGVRVDPRPVVRLEVEQGKLAGIVVGRDEEVVPREALFVAGAPAPHDAFLAELGAAFLPSGWPEVDFTGKTSVPGVWAVGQAADPMHLVISAAASGARAAAVINADLLEEVLNTSHTGHAGHAGHADHGTFSPANVARLLGEQRHAPPRTAPTRRDPPRGGSRA